MFFDNSRSGRSRLAFCVTTTYFRSDGRASAKTSMLHNRLQSRYTDDSSAETHHDHRRGCADEIGMLGMNEANRPSTARDMAGCAETHPKHTLGPSRLRRKFNAVNATSLLEQEKRCQCNRNLGPEVQVPWPDAEPRPSDFYQCC